MDDGANPMRNTLKRWGLPLLVGALYLVLLPFNRQGVLYALRASLVIGERVFLPLCLAFIVMLAISLFVDTARISSLIGKKRSIKGLLIAIWAGVLSMGPIYAWYPLLRGLKRQGASDFYLVSFLSARSVKPFLFPVMIFYFGWIYTATINTLILLSAPLIGAIVAYFSER